MKIIEKGRGKGKTTELIKISAEKQIPILCHTSQSINYILEMAEKMGMSIPRPLVLKDLNLKQYQGKELLIDNVDLLLQNYLGHKINAITLTSEGKQEESNTNYYDGIVKKLKLDADKLTRQLDMIDKTGDYNKYIACLKSLKETLNLIHEYDWQENYSRYTTGDDNHVEVATWKQNSDGDIKNHKTYIVSREFNNDIYDVRDFTHGIIDEMNKISRNMLRLF